jgi:hypothetical protein
VTPALAQIFIAQRRPRQRPRNAPIKSRQEVLDGNERHHRRRSANRRPLQGESARSRQGQSTTRANNATPNQLLTENQGRRRGRNVRARASARFSRAADDLGRLAATRTATPALGPVLPGGPFQRRRAICIRPPGLARSGCDAETTQPADGFRSGSVGRFPSIVQYFFCMQRGGGVPQSESERPHLAVHVMSGAASASSSEMAPCVGEARPTVR